MISLNILLKELRILEVTSLTNIWIFVQLAKWNKEEMYWFFFFSNAIMSYIMY